jgi:hypothetical protein
MLGSSAAAAKELVANPSFRQAKPGTSNPAGWTLSGGEGRWVDRSILEITGDGKSSNSNLWRSDEISLAPGGLYRFQVKARLTNGTGCCISGPECVNYDSSSLTNDWSWISFVFRMQDDQKKTTLRLGQWEAKGTMQFDEVRLTSVVPVYRAVGAIQLGDGESIHDGRYAFIGSFAHEGTDFHRTLKHATARFNSNRWCFGDGSQVTYRFSIPHCPLEDGEITVNSCHYVRGECAVETSLDGRVWRTVKSLTKLESITAKLPADLFPAKTVFVRLRGTGKDASFQIDRVDFSGKLAGKPASGSGSTAFADVETPGLGRLVRGLEFADDFGAGRGLLRIALKNPGKDKATATLTATCADPSGKAGKPSVFEKDLVAGGQAMAEIPVAADVPGAYKVRFKVSEPGESPFVATLHYTVPEYFRSDYGQTLQDGGDDAPSVWWCDATWKIARRRATPAAKGQAAMLSAAKNDREAVQIVVRAKQSLKNLTATASPLVGPDGATIPAEKIKVMRVRYHYVENPTDPTGVRDWWPDALPPMNKPVTTTPNANQPIWVLVHVPAEAKAGDYAGTLKLAADGWSAEAPIRLHVWDFALPDRNHIETAFGLDSGMVFRYHQLKTDEEKRKVLAMYLESFAEHRISPYDPTPIDHFNVKFVTDAKPPRVEIDFAAFDRAMEDAIKKYHFTSFTLPVQGMGGGTFHERWEPKIGPFDEKTPEYQALFASQMKQIEDHLRKKDWLSMAYTYWFDEPDPKDYEFVRNGMARIRKSAPSIRRMLTEEPSEELIGSVDIWCPLTPAYDAKLADKCRDKGGRFWWYVCCGPKAPFCTLFIDHPATELRVWHWQAWQRNIVGHLVWCSNWWTSAAAFPDKPQNPYDDPMGYTDGYGLKPGTKAFWGNGDGRFLYPPESAAVPGLSGSAPVIAPPVSSIRWEMLREGVEDYEYLYLLRDLLAKKRDQLPAERVKEIENLLTVPVEITKDITTFTKDASPIYARRAAVAEAIEQLGK